MLLHTRKFLFFFLIELSPFKGVFSFVQPTREKFAYAFFVFEAVFVFIRCLRNLSGHIFEYWTVIRLVFK